MNKINKVEYIDGAINKLEKYIKHGKIKVRRKKIKDSALKDFHDNVGNPTADRACAKARRTAHTDSANYLREISQEIQKDIK